MFLALVLALATLAGCHGKAPVPAGPRTSDIAEVLWLKGDLKLAVRVSTKVGDTEVDSAVWEVEAKSGKAAGEWRFRGDTRGT